MSLIAETVPRASGRGRAIGGQLIGWCISIACIAFVASKVDFHALSDALVHFEREWIVYGLISLAAGYATRIVRWATMLRAAGASVKASACIAPFLGSIALNNVLPFRAGDVVRALVFPARLGVARTTSTASLLLERVMDMAALLSCLGVGLALLGPAVELPPRLQVIVVTLSIGTAIGLAALVFASLPIAVLFRRIAAGSGSAAVRKVAGIAASLLVPIGAMSRPRALTTLGLLSIVVWLCEAGLYYALMRGLQIPSGAAAALTVVSTTTLSTLVPSTPGYIGPFHLAAYAAVMMLGSTASVAGAFAVLAHFTLWATTTLAGAIAILFRRDLFGRARSPELRSTAP